MRGFRTMSSSWDHPDWDDGEIEVEEFCTCGATSWDLTISEGRDGPVTERPVPDSRPDACAECGMTAQEACDNAENARLP